MANQSNTRFYVALPNGEYQTLLAVSKRLKEKRGVRVTRSQVIREALQAMARKEKVYGVREDH